MRGLPFLLAASLLAGCGQNPAPDDAPAPAPESVRVEPAAQALTGAHIATIDPATLADAEILKVVGARPHCTFRYTSTGKPVAVAGLGAGGAVEAGVVKLNGKLVALQPEPAAAGSQPGGFALAADRVRLRVQPRQAIDAADANRRVEADMVFEIGQDLKVGYGGYLTCQPGAPAPAAARQ